MKIRSILLVLIIAFSFHGCEKNASFEGSWLGVAYEMDKEVEVPFAAVMQAKANGDYNVYPLGEADSNWSKWEQKSGLLILDTNKYLNTEYELGEDHFIIDRGFKVYYRRLKAYPSISQEQLVQHLKGTSWESEYDEVYFGAEDQLIIHQKSDNTTANACWSTLEESGSVFILKKGNQFGCDDFIRFPEHVTEITDDNMTVYRWEEDAWKAVRYWKVENTISDFQPDPFQLCNPYLYRNNPHHRYYYKDTFYKGGIYKINKLLKDQYVAPEGSTENGLFKVEFIVNCQGKAGNFSSIGFDLNYELKEFDPAISSQLFTFSQQLMDWHAGKNKAGENIDTYRYLMYKIRNGEVVEIFP